MTAMVEGAVAELWATFRARTTRPLDWRLEQLAGMRRFLLDNQDQLVDALHDDLGTPWMEAVRSNIAAVLSEIALATRRLPEWAAPRRLETPAANLPEESWQYPEPYGPVLVLSPWNIPVGLCLLAGAGALAAGNPVALKPSELAPLTSSVLAAGLPKYVDEGGVRVFEGGADVAEELLRHRFGLIHFTGSPRVGRLVMAAAAPHLTPVVLELGGKAPAYVHADVDVDATAKRIAFGRLYNAGQACIAVDHVLVHEAVRDELVAAIGRAVDRFYEGDPSASPDYGRIVNDTHFDRLSGLLDDRAHVVYGGRRDRDTRYLEPTIVLDPPADHALLQEEIFGPILPVVTVSGVDDAIARITARPEPLSVYVFTDDAAVADRVLLETRSGTAAVNSVLTIVGNQALPFGGVGESGMGSYTGEDSFRCFSHLKSVAKAAGGPDDPSRLPPFGDVARDRLRQRLADS
jgi:aldehyde dehydrogenase (NAD+)